MLTTSLTEAVRGWTFGGFEAMLILALWVALVLLHGLFRSLYRPDLDPIRPSGPLD